jgi:hypothetical protein
MKTISTKYFSATATKPSRVKATEYESQKSVTLSYDYGVNLNENHKAVATALLRKLGWEGRMIGGHTGTGMVFVFDADLYTIEA